MSPPRPLVAVALLPVVLLGAVFIASMSGREGIALLIVATAVAAIATMALVTWTPVLATCAWRRRLRHRRDLHFFEVVLSTHDESRLGDVGDMMEMLLGHTRVPRGAFAAAGQPPLVIQSQCMTGASGHPEVFVQVGCLPELVAVIESAMHTAYPDVRLGWRTSSADRQSSLPLSFEPRAVSRWRKSRSFVHPVMPERPDESTPPLRAVLVAQAALGAPSVLRVTIIPAREMAERHARERFRRHENRLERASSWGLREAGLKSRLASQELSTAASALNRALAHCVIETASTTPENAERIGSALRAHRGSNRLYSEILVRRRAALRRFVAGRTPLLLDMTLRRLFSSAELAFLLVLPGAEAKDVPLRRLKRPRLPAPPNTLTRTGAGPGWSDADVLPTPTADRPEADHAQ